MDDAGLATAHIVGNSLGGYVALQLAARGRAESVVAFAPAGGWAEGDESFKDLLGFRATLHDQVKAAAPHAEARSWPQQPVGAAQRSSSPRTSSTFPPSCFAHQMLGVASCKGALPMLEYGAREGWSLEASAGQGPMPHKHRGQRWRFVTAGSSFDCPVPDASRAVAKDLDIRCFAEGG